jgi:hypothetical protein
MTFHIITNTLIIIFDSHACLWFTLPRQQRFFRASWALLFEVKTFSARVLVQTRAGVLRDPTEYLFENSPGFSAILWSFSPVFYFLPTACG